MEQFIQMLLSLAAGALGGLVVSLVYVIMEAAKGLIPKFASAPAGLKVSVAILLGGAVGVALSFIPEIGLAWYVGLIVGLLAGATTAGVRALGKSGPARKKTKSNKGFARLTTMILTALAALVMLGTLSGCAHLTPKEQQAITATLACSTDILTSAQTCVPECLEIANKDDQKACSIACVLATLESVAPTCSKVYGDIYSPGLGTAISATVVAIMKTYDEAVDK